jgi:hypothetical protein
MPEKKKEPEIIELSKCTLNKDNGRVICKVNESQYEEIRKGKIVKKIEFEVEEK